MLKNYIKNWCYLKTNYAIENIKFFDLVWTLRRGDSWIFQECLKTTKAKCIFGCNGVWSQPSKLHIQLLFHIKANQWLYRAVNFVEVLKDLCSIPYILYRTVRLCKITPMKSLNVIISKISWDRIESVLWKSQWSFRVPSISWRNIKRRFMTRTQTV